MPLPDYSKLDEDRIREIKPRLMILISEFHAYPLLELAIAMEEVAGELRVRAIQQPET